METILTILRITLFNFKWSLWTGKTNWSIVKNLIQPPIHQVINLAVLIKYRWVWYQWWDWIQDEIIKTHNKREEKQALQCL